MQTKGTSCKFGGNPCRCRSEISSALAQKSKYKRPKRHVGKTITTCSLQNPFTVCIQLYKTRAEVIWQKATSLGEISCRYLLSYSPGGSKCHEVGHRGHLALPFWGRGGYRRSVMAPFERVVVVSYRLSIVTTSLSLTTRPQFTIKHLRRSNQQGRVTL